MEEAVFLDEPQSGVLIAPGSHGFLRVTHAFEAFSLLIAQTLSESQRCLGLALAAHATRHMLATAASWQAAVLARSHHQIGRYVEFLPPHSSIMPGP